MAVLSIEYVKELIKKRQEINKLNLDEIIWTENGNIILFNPEAIEHFMFTGLNNIDFISTGYYKEAMKREI
jgi:hypothetical protein